MSRVYSAMTGTGRPVPQPVEMPDDGVWENSEAAPYVEIGGPGGPVYAGPQSPPTAPAAADAAPSAVREFPRLVPPTPTYLSVRLHEEGSRPSHAPEDGLDPGLVVWHQPDHPVSGEYRRLREEIGRHLADTPSRVVVFASGRAEAGTTTVVLNLAAAWASGERVKVVVVDADVPRPAVAARLGLRPIPGLAEVLAQGVPLAWAVQPTAVPNLHALAAGHRAGGSSPQSGLDLARLLGQLRQWYDWVLVDAGVWDQWPEREGACPAADAVYLVSREADTTRPEFLRLKNAVVGAGGLLRGYIATRCV